MVSNVSQKKKGVKQRRYEKQNRSHRKNYPSAINNKLHTYKENKFEDREH